MSRRREARRPGDVAGARVPLRPGRGAFSRRTRLLLAVGLAVALVVDRRGRRSARRLEAAAAALGDDPGRRPERAARAASAAAEAVGFQPPSASGIGTIENEPAAAAGRRPARACSPVGAQAPAFTLRDARRARRSRSPRCAGKAVLLEFFATWCPHCAAEAPHLRRLAASLPRSQVAFVAVDANGERRAERLRLPRLLRPAVPRGARSRRHDRPRSRRTARPGRCSKAYRVSTFPTFYVVDPQGRIAWRGGGRAARRAAAPRAPVGGAGRRRRAHRQPRRRAARPPRPAAAPADHRRRVAGPPVPLTRGSPFPRRLHAARASRAPGRPGRAQGEPAPHRASLPRLLAQARRRHRR